MKLLIQGDTAVCDREMFYRLPDYSASHPTGTTPGKRWKRRKDYYDEAKGWLLGEYIADSDPGYMKIKFRELFVV